MDSTRNLAARAGRWSAQHRKKAIFGWLAFVAIAVVIGGSVGTKTLGDGDFGIGESGRADKVVSDHFKDKGADESVLVQSRDGARTTDPQFRAVVDELVGRLEHTKNVQNVHSPYGRDSAGQLSEDGRSALVTFELPGDERRPTRSTRRSTRSRRSPSSTAATGSSSSATAARTRRSRRPSRTTSRRRRSPRCRSRS